MALLDALEQTSLHPWSLLGLVTEHLFQILCPSCNQEHGVIVGTEKVGPGCFLKAESDTVWPCGSKAGTVVVGAVARAQKLRSQKQQKQHPGWV